SQGHVKLYSEPAQGTTVKLYLPRLGHQPEPAATAPAPHSAPAAPVPAPAPEPGARTILLVEDDELVRRYAHDQLLALGYRVLQAHTGPRAPQIRAQHPEIDLLFTDVVMPGGMSGRQLADAALQQRPHLRVLYTSGYTENAIVHHGRLDP